MVVLFAESAIRPGNGEPLFSSPREVNLWAHLLIAVAAFPGGAGFIIRVTPDLQQ